MRSRRSQYAVGFCLILMLFMLRTALTAGDLSYSESGEQLETVAQRLHKDDPLGFIYTTLDATQDWRERIPSNLRLEDLALKGSISLAERLIGLLPVPTAIPNTTVHEAHLQPAKPERLDSYLREMFSWAM